MNKTREAVQDSQRSITRRGLLMGGGMTAMIAALGLRMRYLQIDQAEEFRLLAEENRINIRLIPPVRGQIQDRNGKLIAGNEQNYRIVITREDAGDFTDVLARVRRLAPMTDEEVANTIADINKNSAFVPVLVKDRLDWKEFSRVAANTPALPGITTEVGLSRIYPRDTDFAHVVGYVAAVSDKDLEEQDRPDPVLRLPKFQIGKIGVERFMETTLRGEAGTRRIEVNSVGRVMRDLDHTQGEPGADVRLTINADLQNFAQARLGGESGSVVVMDVRNGDIVCCASAPSFDPNLFVRGISYHDYSVLTENDHRPLVNKTVSGAYPPGSTFKVVTALAALESGVIGLGHRAYCPGHLEFGGRRFHCWKRGGHGTVDLTNSLSWSCDVFYYDVAQRVGIDEISAMGRRLGLGTRHDLPISAIAEGNMPTKAWKRERYEDDWRVGDTINASIGQGYILATPLQLAVMTARIASGRAVVPRLVRAIDDKEQPVPEAVPLDISEAYLRAIRLGMHEVVNASRGTAQGVRIVSEDKIFAGKTGTSQVRNISASERASGVVRNEQLPWNRRDHALFVGYAPYDAPRYAVSVVIEHGGGGSVVAGPVARDVILAAMAEGLPPLSAYPSSQRGRIESMLNELKLRDPATGAAPKAERA